MRSVKELLKELKARIASEVIVGKLPAVAGSSDPALAAKRSNELAEKPQFFAQSANVMMNVAREEALALISAGAKKA